MDTNWSIGVLARREVRPPDPHFSVLTRIELLSIVNLSPGDLLDIDLFLDRGVEIQIDPIIASTAADLRRAYRGRLPDAVIAATALVYDLPLLTRDRGMARYASRVPIVGLD